MGIEAAKAAAAVGAGKPVEAGSVVNNGLKDVPWIKILNFNVTKENLEKSAADYPWWFGNKA